MALPFISWVTLEKAQILQIVTNFVISCTNPYLDLITNFTDSFVHCFKKYWIFVEFIVKYLTIMAHFKHRKIWRKRKNSSKYTPVLSNLNILLYFVHIWKKVQTQLKPAVYPTLIAVPFFSHYYHYHDVLCIVPMQF